MTYSLERFPFLSGETTQSPYLPYPIAVESGVLDDPHAKAKPLDDPAGVILASGYIPNAHEAGLVDTGHSVFAFDLVALDVEADEVRITPASKSRVKSDGQITEEGLIVIENQEGLMRFAAFAIDVFKRPWLANRLGQSGVNTRRSGRIAVFSAAAFEIPDHEIMDVDLLTSSMLAKPRARYF